MKSIYVSIFAFHWLKRPFFPLLLLLILTAGLALLHATRPTQAQPPTPQTSNGCNLFPINITKSVAPANPHQGSSATIQFSLSQLNTKQIDVALVYDISSSMRGQKLADAQTHGRQFVQTTASNDRTAVITFDNTPHLVQPLTSDKQTAITAIDSLSANGGSNLLGGLQLAYQELIHADHHNPNTVKAIILFSDGRTEDPEAVKTQATVSRDCGILIYTIGYGNDVEPETMQAAATITDGRYSFATASSLTAVQQEISIGQRNIIIHDELPPDVALPCTQAPTGWECSRSNDGTTQMRYPLSDERPLPNPHTLTFTATINLPPAYETQLVNTSNACVSHDGPGNPTCQPFNNPPVCIQPYLEDNFEPDDEWGEFILPVSNGEPAQERTFGHSQDAEWLRTELLPHSIYTFTTAAISPNLGNRELALYQWTGGQLILLASDTNQLVWNADTIPPTATPTATPTASPTPEITATPTPTATPTAVNHHNYLPTTLKNGRSFPRLTTPQDDPTYIYLRISASDNQFGCGTRYQFSLTVNDNE